jgi:predicted amidohydrolase
MRLLRTAAAQLGPIQKDDSRQAVVRRMIDLMDEAKGEGADLIVYPELALTTFFPRWHHADRAEADHWFEAGDAKALALLDVAARSTVAKMRTRAQGCRS